MTNKELKALRQLFFLECSEAAKHIAGVSTRSWQHWESGKYDFPEDVEDAMHVYKSRRANLTDEISERFVQEQNPLVLRYYPSFEEYTLTTGTSDYVMWKITNSVHAEALSAGIASLE